VHNRSIAANMRVARFANVFDGASGTKSYMRIYYTIFVPTSYYTLWFDIISTANESGASYENRNQ